MAAAPFVRSATAADLPAISAIYNHYVRTSTATWQLAEETPAERAAWFAAHGPAHAVTVVVADGVVAAWGSLSPFHGRAAFARTAEDSLYVHHDHLRRGFGRLLLADLIARARASGTHLIVAAISADQTPSLDLHRALGFTPCGVLREAGRKFDRWLDLAYWQLPL
jgi:phosphinothricin acetyltransferase